MKKILFLLTSLALTSCATHAPSPANEKLSFDVSMENPSSHLWHVDFHCDGLGGAAHNFIIPAWMPGAYRMVYYYRNITNFAASDAAGHALSWSKTDSNTWHVLSPGVTALTVSYDVLPGRAAAQCTLNETNGFIAPCSAYMYLDRQILRPVTVTIKPKDGWTIATGLDPVPGQTNTYSAPDFDVLYDCPTLVGPIERIPFEVKGIHHEFDGVNMGAFDRAKFTSDLKRMVESATTLMGDIAYKHYNFLAAGTGGGIEHLDETTLPFRSADVASTNANKRWLSFVGHEYFHNYNVKRIRPIVLGPFDYEHENHTHMLWVSEGFTDYYAWIVLRRAGLLTVEDCLNGTGGQRGFEGLAGAIALTENAQGHLYQSAAQASWDTWTPTGQGNGPGISYYEKGNALGTLLDLAIRHESKNQKSLDDVMRGLYQAYFQEKKRGFTDEEFRKMCEHMAGTKLDEVFAYAYTTKAINYPKYFNYAGLNITLPTNTVGELGAAIRPAPARGETNKVIVSAVEPFSSAATSGLATNDVIIRADGQPATIPSFNALIKSKKPGDAIEIVFTHNGTERTARITFGSRLTGGTFKFTRQPHPDALQEAIYKDWLRGPEPL